MTSFPKVLQLKPRVVEFCKATFKTHAIASREIEGRPDLAAFYTCFTSTIISVSYCYPRSRAFATRVYIRLRPIPVTLIILAIGTLSFNIVSALIRVSIEYSLRIRVLVPEAEALDTPLKRE